MSVLWYSAPALRAGLEGLESSFDRRRWSPDMDRYCLGQWCIKCQVGLRRHMHKQVMIPPPKQSPWYMSFMNQYHDNRMGLIHLRYYRMHAHTRVCPLQIEYLSRTCRWNYKYDAELIWTGQNEHNWLLAHVFSRTTCSLQLKMRHCVLWLRISCRKCKEWASVWGVISRNSLMRQC